MSWFGDNADDKGGEALLRIEDLERRISIASQVGAYKPSSATIVGRARIGIDNKTIDICSIRSASGYVSIMLRYTGSSVVELMVGGLSAGIDYFGSGLIMCSAAIEPNTDTIISLRGVGRLDSYSGIFLGDNIRIDRATSAGLAVNGDSGLMVLCEGMTVYAMSVASDIGDRWEIGTGVYCDISAYNEGYIVAIVDTSSYVKLITLDSELAIVDILYTSAIADRVAICVQGSDVYIATIYKGALRASKLVGRTLLEPSTVVASGARYVKWGVDSSRVMLAYSDNNNKSFAKLAASPIGDSVAVVARTSVLLQ